MKKRILSFFLALAMVLTMVPATRAEAATAEGLYFRYAGWDDTAMTHYEDTTYPYEQSLGGFPNTGALVYFYYVDASGAETKLSAADLTVADPSVVTISDSTEYATMIHVDYVGFGTTQISYETGGNTYSVNATVDLPTFGFYSAPSATQSNYITEFTVTNQSNTFYFVPTNGWKLTSVTASAELANIGSVTLAADGSYAEIVVTGTPSNGWYGLGKYEAEDAYGNKGGGDHSLRLIDGRDSLFYRWPGGYVDNAPVENTDYSQEKIWVTSPNSGSDMFFYIRENGVETRLTADQLVSSDENVVKILANDNNADAVRLMSVGFGNATVSYTTSSGATYSVNVTVDLPSLGFYTDTTASQQTYINSFKVTETERTFYLILRDGRVLTSVVPQDRFADIATVEISADKTYATITVTGTPENGWGYDLMISMQTADGRTDTGHLGLFLYNGMPSLMYRHSDYSNGPVENTSYSLESSFNMAKGHGNIVFFYYTVDGVETRLTADQLTSSNTDIVKVSASEENADAVFVEAVGFGDATISYTVNGKTYEVDVTVGLPDFGFYTSTTASQGSYIREFTVTDTNQTFYFAPISSDWVITDIVIEGNFANIATVDLAQDGSYATITVNGNFSGDMWLDVKYSANNTVEPGWNAVDFYEGMLVKNGKPYIGFCWPNDQSASGHGPINKYLYTAPGYATDVWVYFVDGTTETMLSMADLTSSDASVIEIVDPGYSNGMVNLKTTGWGNATVSYTKDGKTYSFDVVSELQIFGYYTDDVIDQSTWTRSFTVTDTEKTLYFMAQPGYTFDVLTPNQELQSIANIQMNADKNCVTITFTGIPDEDCMYGFDFEFTDPNGWTGQGGDYINVLNGTSTQITKVDVLFDGNDGSITVTDGVNTEVFGAASDRFVAGTCVKDTGITFLDPVFWDSTRAFAGWIVMTEETVTDAEGNSWTEWVQIPGTGLMTTAEMMAYTIPAENIIFLAQWAGDDADYYTDVFLDIYGGVFSFLENADDPNSEVTSDNWGCRFHETSVGKTVYDELRFTITKEPTMEGYTFEGWLEMDGEFNLISTNIYTTNQILGIDPLADGTYKTIQSDTIVYTVKWKELPMSAYGVQVEVEDLPVVDPSKPVEDVVVGVDKEATEETLVNTASGIVEEINAGNADQVDEIPAEVVEAIADALNNNKNLTVTTTVNVETLEGEALETPAVQNAVAMIEAKAGDAEIAQILDLKVEIAAHVDGELAATGNVSELEEAIIFTAVIPEEMMDEMKDVPDGHELVVFVLYVHDGQVYRIDDVTLDGNSVSFPADQFSTYALAYEHVEKKAETPAPQPKPESKPESKPQAPSVPNSPHTGDSAPVMLYIVLALVSVMAIVVVESKRRAVRR